MMIYELQINYLTNELAFLLSKKVKKMRIGIYDIYDIENWYAWVSTRNKYSNEDNNSFYISVNLSFIYM